MNRRHKCLPGLSANAPGLFDDILNKYYTNNRETGHNIVSRLATDKYPSFVTYCHVLLRSLRLTRSHEVGHLRRVCNGKFFNVLKNFHGVHDSHGVSRLSIPSPYVVLRSPRFVHGVPKRCCPGRREQSDIFPFKVIIYMF